MTDEDLTELLNRCFDLITSRGQPFPDSEGLQCFVENLQIERWNEDDYDELNLNFADGDLIIGVRIFLRPDGRPNWSRAIETSQKIPKDDLLDAERALATLRKHLVLDDLASS